MVFEHSHDPDAIRCTIIANDVHVSGRNEISHFQETIVCIPSIQLVSTTFAIAPNATRYSNKLMMFRAALAPDPFLRIGVRVRKVREGQRLVNGSSYVMARKQKTAGPPTLSKILRTGRLEDNMQISPTVGAIDESSVGVRPNMT